MYTIVCSVVCTLCCVYGGVYTIGLQCGVYSVVCTLSCIHCGAYTVVRTLWCIHCGAYTVVCTLVCTLWCVHCGVYTIVCTLWCVHYGVYTVVCSKQITSDRISWRSRGSFTRDSKRKSNLRPRLVVSSCPLTQSMCLTSSTLGSMRVVGSRPAVSVTAMSSSASPLVIAFTRTAMSVRPNSSSSSIRRMVLRASSCRRSNICVVTLFIYNSVHYRQFI